MRNSGAEKEYEVHYYEVDCKKRVLMTSIIDFFNDVAVYHAEKAGLSLEYMLENNMAWILYKWDINIKRYPKYGEKITVGTEAYAKRKFYAYRKFYILDSKGETIATANSVWLLINVKERKAIRITEHILEAYDLVNKNDIIKVDKIGNVQEEKNSIEFKVRYSDIDTNGHVNNEKYAAWMIESVPLDVVENYNLKNIKIKYRKETMYGETVKVLSEAEDKDDKVIYTHKIIRENGEELTRGETIWEKNI